MAKYTNERLIDLLKNKAKEIGHTPTKREFPQYQTVATKIGWSKALELAGLIKNYNRTKKDYISLINECQAKLGTCPSWNDFVQSGHDASIVSDMFGSWNNALKEAELEINREKVYIGETKEELVAKYITLCNELGYLAGKTELKDNGLYSDQTFRVKFGGINELRKIVLEDSRLKISNRCYKKGHKKYSKKQVIAILIDLYNSNGNKRLTTTQLKKLHKGKNIPGITTIYSAFKTTKINEIWLEIEHIISSMD